MKITTSYLSEQGGRDKNDDTVCVIREENRICAIVGDGLGGYDGGKLASMKAAETIAEYRKQHDLLKETEMQTAAEQADQMVKRQQLLRNGNMKTTLVVLEMFCEQEDVKARWMHVGDSRLYHFKNGKLIGQTMDHSVSQVSVLMGEITQEEIRFHEDRNRVLRALGSDNAKPDISRLTRIVEKKESFLLCTDGFWEYVYEKEMEDTLKESKTPEMWLEKMKVLLEERVTEGNDNYTVAAVFCER